MSGTRQSPHRTAWHSDLDLDLDGFEHRFDAVDQPEDLLLELRAAIAVHRSRVPPRLTAEHELVPPARTADRDRDAIVAAHTRILDEELAALVERMDVVQADLLQRPSSSSNRLHAVTLLAAAAALETVAARFNGEVVAPLVTETPTATCGGPPRS